jgi:hypothetical protein
VALVVGISVGLPQTSLGRVWSPLLTKPIRDPYLAVCIRRLKCCNQILTIQESVKCQPQALPSILYRQ